MRCNPKIISFVCLFSIVVTGCFPTQPRYLREPMGGDLSYYLDQATGIEYPDVDARSLEEVVQSRPPITVIDPDFERFYDLTLEECVSIALQNSKVIRGYGTPGLQGSRVSPGLDNLTNGLAGVGTLYNVAIRESEPGFIGLPGQIQNPGFVLANTALDANQGVEAALAEFDAQYSAQAFWGRSDEPRNTVAPFDQLAFQQDQFTLQHQLAKKSAEGTQYFLRNTTIHTDNNIPLVGDGGFQLFPSWWRTNIELEVRQPLLRGRGAFINRMPIVISRIGTDQEIANIEGQLQNMVTNVEIRYWDLQLAYRLLEASKDGRNAALETWRIVKSKYDEKADVNIQQVASAKAQYHFFDSQVIDSFNNLLSAEADLRFLLGISQSDGQLIRPIDEPVVAPVEFDYCQSLDEALAYRPELRQQKWEIKKQQLALAYAKNSLLPVLNATGLYRWQGMGTDLTNVGGNPPPWPAPNSGATNELLHGRYQEFQFGLDYAVPVGLRREMSNVVNSQIKVAREQARLEDLELDTSRELQQTLRAIAANRNLMQTAFNQWVQNSIEVEHFEELAAQGTATINIALDSQRSRAQAQQSFYSALAEYNKAIALFHRRKGTILAYNGISMGEGPWTGKAYQDASELARKRSASREVNYGWTRPEVISRGPGGPTFNLGTAHNDLQAYPSMPSVDDIFMPLQQYDGYIEGSEGYIQEDDLPMIIDWGSTQKPETGVRAVGYESSTTTSAARIAAEEFRRNPQPTSSPSRMHAGNSQTESQGEMPKRDTNTAPNGLRNEGPQVQDTDWGRFGLSKPNLNDGNVNATFKSQQQ